MLRLCHARRRIWVAIRYVLPLALISSNRSSHLSGNLTNRTPGLGFGFMPTSRVSIAMRVCNGLGVGVDVDQELRHGARYQDKRAVAKQMWASVMDILRLIKAIPVAAA
jgi:hypothetical protein